MEKGQENKSKINTTRPSDPLHWRANNADSTVLLTSMSEKDDAAIVCSNPFGVRVRERENKSGLQIQSADMNRLSWSR